MPDDSNPFIEWADAPATVADDGAAAGRTRATTAPHDLTELARATERDEAFKRGLAEGVELTIAAIYKVMRKWRLTRVEMDNIALNVRQEIEKP